MVPKNWNLGIKFWEIPKIQKIRASFLQYYLQVRTGWAIHLPVLHCMIVDLLPVYWFALNRCPIRVYASSAAPPQPPPALLHVIRASGSANMPCQRPYILLSLTVLVTSVCHPASPVSNTSWLAGRSSNSTRQSVLTCLPK